MELWEVLAAAGLGILVAFSSSSKKKEGKETEEERDTSPSSLQRGCAGHFDRPPAQDVVFLDFDGVLHPGCSETFAFRDIFENLMRDWPQVDIVLSTDWRTTAGWGYLKELFSSDIAARIVGTTPTLGGEYSRYREIAQTVERFGVKRWLALDDRAALFPASCQELVLLDPLIGIGGDGEALVRSAFHRHFGGGTPVLPRVSTN